MSLKETIKNDLFRYEGNNSLKSFISIYRTSPGFRYTFYLRLVNAYSKKSIIGLLSRFMYNRLSCKFGFQVPKSVKIGKGFLLMHFGHVIINSKATIGDNCNIYPGVTIGATFRGEKEGIPKIGNRVWIGTGAVIVGDVTIEDNVLIAPNAYINFSVPPNSIVLGNPGKIIPKEDATNKYIYHTV